VARDNDERMLTGLKGGSINQYLVLVEPALGNREGGDRGAGAIPLTAQSSTSIPLSSFGSAYSDSKASISSPSFGSSQNGKSSAIYDKKIEDLFWVNVDTNSGRATKNVYNSAADRRKDFYESFKTYVENKIEKGNLYFFITFYLLSSFFSFLFHLHVCFILSSIMYFDLSITRNILHSHSCLRRNA
jgi:hypothetical protein